MCFGNDAYILNLRDSGHIGVQLLHLPEPGEQLLYSSFFEVLSVKVVLNRPKLRTSFRYYF